MSDLSPSLSPEEQRRIREIVEPIATSYEGEGIANIARVAAFEACKQLMLFSTKRPELPISLIEAERDELSRQLSEQALSHAREKAITDTLMTQGSERIEELRSERDELKRRVEELEFSVSCLSDSVPAYDAKASSLEAALKVAIDGFKFLQEQSQPLQEDYIAKKLAEISRLTGAPKD